MLFKKTIIICILSFFSLLLLTPFWGISNPIIQSIPPETAIANKAYHYQIKAIDGFGSKLTYHLLQAPEDMSIDNSTGLIKWIPDECKLGENKVKVEITNLKSQEILELLDTLNTEEEAKLNSSIIYEFTIQVIEKGLEENVSNLSESDNKNCSENNKANSQSIFTSIFGSG